MNELTITIYKRGDGDFGFDVYDVKMNRDEDGDEVDEVDSGVCTSNMHEALDMAREMAKEILNRKTSLLCQYKGCYKLQGEDGEFCHRHNK